MYILNIAIGVGGLLFNRIHTYNFASVFPPNLVLGGREIIFGNCCKNSIQIFNSKIYFFNLYD